MKKRIAKFVYLKILELGGTAFVYSVLLLISKMVFIHFHEWGKIYIIGPVFIGCAAMAIGCVVYLLFVWIKWNWEKAGDMENAKRCNQEYLKEDY